ncbi:MAG: hypothetical protein NTV81_00300 [Candidatus Komeilibacteria bacterium]|nr:hypothetical protein [Candidatus Komeilibacteria bacterium]
MDDWGKVPLAVKPPTSVLPKPVQSLEGVMPQAIKPQAVSTASTAGFRKPLVWQDQKITEVKRSYKLVSPLEELALLNLEMFRKLGDHSAAVQKIREKIVVLGEESIGKGSQAIVAWRKSPLNQMYVKIGQLSLNQGEHVADVINQLTGQGERILTLAEFEAISDLNQALRA